MKKSIIALGITSVLSLSSQAALIADWDFTTGSGLIPDGDLSVGTLLLASTENTVLAGASSSDLISEGKLRYEDANGTLGEYNFKDFHLTAAPGRGAFTFTLTADGSNTIDVTSLVMSSYRNGAGAPAQLQWHVSVDGGIEEEYGTEQVGQTGGFALDTFTESITGASSVKFTFRLDNATGNGNIHFNDIQVNGDVTVVPEPTSTALLGLGGLALVLRRRK